MAYAITARHWMGDKEYIEAVLDSADDLAALGDGYAPDSRAIVAEGGAAYMTDASGHWQELGSPGGGGGGNPNYVETIEGTLGYPWGDYSLRNDLAPKILSNDIDFYVTFSLNGASYTAFPNRGNTSAVTRVCSAYSLTATTARVSSLRYSPNGTLQSAKVIPELSESNGIWSGNGITLDSTTPCTLTIIHHPLPSNE